MSRSLFTAAVLVCAVAGTAAIAGTPPLWARDQTTDTRGNGNSNTDRNRDSRDEGRHDNGGDWKRSSEPRRNESGPGNAPTRPAPVQNRPPVVHNPEQNDSTRPAPGQNRPPVVHIPEQNGSTSAPRPNRPPWSHDPAPSSRDQNDGGHWRNDDRGGHVYARDPRPDTDWARHEREQARRNFDHNHWRDNRGRDWNHDRGWYDHYRVDHFHYYNGRYFARDRFRLNFYVVPYGYYRHTWTRGEFLPYSFFDDGYTLGDYWSFGLYDPPFGCDWIRVDNDALLVDAQTGEVLDTVYNLFY